MTDGRYSNIREFLGPIVGATILEVTQHDEDEWRAGASYVALHLSSGVTLTFPIGEAGFDIETPDDD